MGINILHTMISLKKIFTRNKKYKSIELKYTRKPSAAILEALRSSDFRWSPYRQHWYAPATEKNEKFAKGLGRSVQTKLKL